MLLVKLMFWLLEFSNLLLFIFAFLMLTNPVTLSISLPRDISPNEAPKFSLKIEYLLRFWVPPPVFKPLLNVVEWGLEFFALLEEYDIVSTIN